jgi:hypothetical protein
MNFLLSQKLSFFLFLLMFFTVSHAQSIEKRIYNTTFTPNPPEIDGYMIDSCWNLVNWGSDFVQVLPYDGRPPSKQTSFKILYDQNNLYVFIRAFDSEPEKISRRLSRRDHFDGDMVEINIDSYYDQQTAFSFTAMASGTKGDEAVTEDGNQWDASWDPVWYLKTSIDTMGWCAEMKIPFSQLRFGKKMNHVWGIQVMRHIFRLEERSKWQFIPKGSPGQIHLFGELHGIGNLKPKRQIELLPYTVGRFERFEKEVSNPFLEGKSGNLSFGLDGKAAIANDLTLDFSVNPDFGQVEADPSEVNLTAYETYFSEKRPFFVEGKSIFEFQPSAMHVRNKTFSDDLFYSRRIGRPPRYVNESTGSVYCDIPQWTTILAAMKLSGKTKNGLSVGVLESITSREKVNIDSAGIRNTETAEPLTNYFAGRLQKDINKGETILGGMITAVNRKIDNPALDFLHSAAYAGGFDFKHSWNERTWYTAGNVLFSYVQGNEEALLATQESSARYFQRPDADYLSVDSSLTSLAGYGVTARLGRTSNKRWQFETSISLRSPGLEYNDMGYMQYADMIHHGTWVGYYLREPFSVFRDFYLNLNYWMYWNFSGELLSTLANLNFNSHFKNLWSIDCSFTRMNEYISTTLLRGGPSFTLPGGEDINLFMSTHQSKKISFYAGNYYSIGDSHSYLYKEYWTGITIRPVNAISVSFEPAYYIQNNHLQYVRTLHTGNETRYIFAELDQKTLSFSFRLNITIRPELTVEYYGQPFVSAGKYFNYKKITYPDAPVFRDRYHAFTESEVVSDLSDNTIRFDDDANGTYDFTIDNPDFNFKQFRSNLVIRWEYIPGSTLYLVWSQGRTTQTSGGRFSYGNDMQDLFQTIPHNVFLLKFSYRLFL